MKLPTKVLAYGFALALEGTVAYATSLPAQADLSLDSVNTEVHNQGNRITSLEARTTNNEQAINTLDNQAGITPTTVPDTTTASPNVSVAPSTTSTPSAPTVATPAAPTTKTVTSVNPKMVNASDVPGYRGVTSAGGKDIQIISCTYGFDDGSQETLYGIQNGFTGDPHNADGSIKLAACFPVGHVVNL